jgi:hypothetical protein
MPIRIGTTRIYILPRTILGRVVGGILAVTVLVLAFFFLFFVLLAAGVVASVFLIRMAFRSKQIKATVPQDLIEGEYSVVPPEQVNITHKP